MVWCRISKGSLVFNLWPKTKFKKKLQKSWFFLCVCKENFFCWILFSYHQHFANPNLSANVSNWPPFADLILEWSLCIVQYETPQLQYCFVSAVKVAAWFVSWLFHYGFLCIFSAFLKKTHCVFSIVFFLFLKNFFNSEIKGSSEKVTGKVKQDLIPRKLICHSAWHPLSLIVAMESFSFGCF